ncbi:Diguanylate cyclase VdcA [Methylobacterium tardum]|jgi:diguanylate cyclase|uniref:diguanylate cyclase n=1 Tax=Methylobacterium tardum TaxID=374432 RepID=A0AA37TPY7_9HYPH|nr:GGDEF domain-containing protein [Methylobacterium tardum]URD37724.1 GGDEF domain-containing protein [Methylobacterium tardum]GJE52202.1 Diguanylate cyclase VdcA [Methylobacterium tardum]GLS73396.1 GGDEF domain-containing protein [Methylobacterium tardum]
MSQETYSDRDRSFALAKRTHDLIRDYGPSATPRAYAVWYAYVSGELPLLSDAVKRLTAQNGCLTEADIDDLHESYLDGRRLASATGEISRVVLSEIAAITEILDLSLGSTAQYGESLRGLAQDLAQGLPNRARLGEIVSTLVSTTREVAVNNRVLEARMRETRSEIETLREKLEATRLESLTDALTGLSNRKHFEETLKATLEAARGRAVPMSLIILDIDFFKRFNDLYGHLTGDQVLRLVAIVMRENAGKDAHLARFGGEEFGIVLPGTDRAAARQVAETVRTSVMGRELVKRSTGESLGKVTVSLGIAVYRQGDTPASLMERADLCMFAAKRGGRNRAVDDTAEALSQVA